MYAQMAAPNPRKRAAPGSSPAVQNAQIPQPYPTSNPPMSESDANFLLRSQGGGKNNFAYQDPLGYNMTYAGNNGLSQPPYDQSVPAPSTQLARRPINRQLVSTGQRPAFDVTSDQWNQFGEDSMVDNPGVEENDNIELLEEKATVAKRDAQAKRKQIPPFVQKLSR
jgi:heat shock transcription factor, other eukaryote